MENFTYGMAGIEVLYKLALDLSRINCDQLRPFSHGAKKHPVCYKKRLGEPVRAVYELMGIPTLDAELSLIHRRTLKNGGRHLS